MLAPEMKRFRYSDPGLGHGLAPYRTHSGQGSPTSRQLFAVRYKSPRKLYDATNPFDATDLDIRGRLCTGTAQDLDEIRGRGGRRRGTFPRTVVVAPQGGGHREDKAQHRGKQGRDQVGWLSVMCKGVFRAMPERSFYSLTRSYCGLLCLV